MCARYLLLEKHYRLLMQRLGVPAPAVMTRYDIAPGTLIPTLRPTARDSTRQPASIHWGLKSSWAARPGGRALVNVRAETLAEKTTFRDALRSRRCVIPASGFYEWQTVGRTKKPWLFERLDKEPFAFAGLWEPPHESGESAPDTCALITTTPNDIMQPIHDRMPVMLTPADCDVWLAPDAEAAKLITLLRPPANEDVHALGGLTRSELLAASSGTGLQDAFAKHFAGPASSQDAKTPDPFAPWFS